MRIYSHPYLIISLLLLCSCAGMKPVVFNGIENARIIDASSKNTEVELSVKIKNPNNFGFNIYKSDFDVKVGSKDIGKASLKNKVHIKANSEITHKFIVQTDLSKILSGGLGSLFSILQSKAVLVTVHGELKTGNFFYKKKFPVDLKESVPLSN